MEVEGISHSARWIEARLRAGLGAWLPLSGFSMSPALSDGDRLEVAPLAAPPRAGEIVVMRRGSRLITHRLISLSEGLAVTRGDACSSDDPPVPAADLIGRVVRVRRHRLWHRIWRGDRC
jgi:phage repressor protein C with HTH and peptisase S24 domain